jgi:hypothetical protein
MLRTIYRSLFVVVALLCIVPAGYANHEDDMNYYYGWARTYTLTPLEHKRLKATGLVDEEVFAVANLGRLTGIYVGDLVQAIQRGETAASLARRYNLDVSEVLSVRPEWKTDAWKEAVERGDYLWIPPRASTSMPSTAPPENR